MFLMNRGTGFWNKTAKKGDVGRVKSKSYKQELSMCTEGFIGFDCQ